MYVISKDVPARCFLLVWTFLLLRTVGRRDWEAVPIIPSLKLLVKSSARTLCAADVPVSRQRVVLRDVTLQYIQTLYHIPWRFPRTSPNPLLNIALTLFQTLSQNPAWTFPQFFLKPFPKPCPNLSPNPSSNSFWTLPKIIPEPFLNPFPKPCLNLPLIPPQTFPQTLPKSFPKPFLKIFLNPA